MATITRFEELEIWQLVGIQADDVDEIVRERLPAKDFESRNQMNASSGSVTDCVAGRFERSGNKEFKNFLVSAKGSNGEYRSQLFRALDRQYINRQKFDSLYSKHSTLGSKKVFFITYLNDSAFKGQRYRYSDAP